MLTNRTHTPRATTWLCLFVAMLIAVLPSGSGLVLCLGLDGHVGLGLATASQCCPCPHDSGAPDSGVHDSGAHDSGANGSKAPVAGAIDSRAIKLADEDQYIPPCDDLAFDAPEVVRDTDPSVRLAKAMAELIGSDHDTFGNDSPGAGGDDPASLSLLAWVLGTAWTPNAACWPNTQTTYEAPWAATRSAMVRQQLEHERCVVLLI